MEFHEKIQVLRKQRGLTQEEMAESLFVSRAAISKWEQGRGYPNIDSLKALAKFFDVSIDELLSGEELLTVAEENTRQKEMQFRDLVFGLLDCGVALLCFLPFFGQKGEGMVHAVTLLSLTEIALYLRVFYFTLVLSSILMGFLILTLQNCRKQFWVASKWKLSLALNILGLFLFIISLQPYAAVYLFTFLTIKVLLLLKKP